MRDFGMV